MTDIATTTAQSGVGTFLSVMSAIILAGLAGTAWLFRRGGVYNPIVKDFTDIPYLPPETPVSTQTPDSPSVPFNHVQEPPVAPNELLWDTPANARHSVRVICDEEGLTLEQKNTLCATVGAESGWKPGAIGKPNTDGTRDYGICQINTYWWIGEGKQFPSMQYVLDNPEACIRWMCTQWKAGHRDWWIAWKNGSWKHYV